MSKVLVRNHVDCSKLERFVNVMPNKNNKSVTTSNSLELGIMISSSNLKV